MLPIVVGGLVVAGCTTETPGDPTATRGPATTTGSASEPTSTSSSSGGDELADFDPCAQLNAVASQFALTRIEKQGTQDCQARWGETTTIVSIKVFPTLGLGDVVLGPNAKPSDVQVGARKAKHVEAVLTTTDCVYAVEITPKSRVDFFAAATASSAEACEAANKLATAVEPKLPK
ncbi:hypothetical protein AB0I60_09170 [Actinosynnema sp. NPDC050436]|uniref:hypothetical protein n=1 Tax=Actinosynnema sp. NPDC050436 TaxID=3155659 RepID=UPI0033FCE992